MSQQYRKEEGTSSRSSKRELCQKRMDTNNLVELISELVGAIEQADYDYSSALEEMILCERLTQDYLHKLELEGLGYHEYAQIALDIRQCRQDRRNAQNTITRYQPVVNFYRTEKGQHPVGQLLMLECELREAETQLRNWVYTPRLLPEDEYWGDRNNISLSDASGWNRDSTLSGDR